MKLLKLSLCLAIIGCGQVNSMEGKNTIVQEDNKTWYKKLQKPSENEIKYYNSIPNPNKIQNITYKSFNNKLPYRFSESEIRLLQDGEQKTILENWYMLVKYTFHILCENSKQLVKIFCNTPAENSLIQCSINIIKNYLKEMNTLNKQILYPFYTKYNKIKTIPISRLVEFFNEISKTNIGLEYLRDITRCNIYSVVIESFKNFIKKQLEKYNLQHPTNKKLKQHNEYHSRSQVQKYIQLICTRINNPARSIICENLLRQIFLYENQYITINNIPNHWLILSGIQQDIYNNYKTNVLVTNLSYEIYDDIDNHNGVGGNYSMYSLIHNGYITDPIIIKDVFNPNITLESYIS